MQVAQVASVSTATASRILNGNGPFAEDTRARVLEAARKLAYVQNPYFRRIRRNDRTASTGNLALLLPFFCRNLYRTDQQIPRVLAGVAAAAQGRNYHLIVSTLAEEEEDGVTMPRVVADGDVDGVVFAGGHSAEIIERIQSVIPALVVNDRISGVGAPCIAVDEVAATRIAFEHLRGLGHRRVTFFYIADYSYVPDAIRDHAHPHVLRADAFKAIALDGSMPEVRIEVLPGRTKPMEKTMADCLLAWRAAGTMPTAVLCAADVYAMALLHAAGTLGIRVPGELSVIGIDDDSACDYVRPNLTSVRAPLEEMGAAAVETLLNRLKNPVAARMTQLFDVKLIERKSCAPPPSTAPLPVSEESGDAPAP